MAPHRKRHAEDSSSSDDEFHDALPAEPPSSLPPSSPPRFPSDLDDEPELAADIDDLEELAEEEEGEDLFGDNLARDYRANPEQDHYNLGDEVIDDADYDELDAASRRRVDARLDARDRAVRARLPDAFLDDDEDDALPTTRRSRHSLHPGGSRDPDEPAELEDVDPRAEELPLDALADVKAPSVAEWIAQPAVARGIARELKNFLLEYTDGSGRSVYGARIRALGEVNAESLEVSYVHLMEAKAVLAMFLAVDPTDMLKIFDVVAMQATELHYPAYSHIHSEIHVRITDLPAELPLRELRQSHLGTLVRVSGVVTRRTGVFPQLKHVKFDCLKCGAVLGPFPQESHREVTVSYCHSCQSHGPFRLNSDKTIYRNYQRITLQEAPGTVPAGRLPRHREVILLWDLIDSAKPGEEVEVTGIYKNTYDGGLNAKNGFPVFATVLEANLVKRREARATEDSAWTDEEEAAFREFSRSRGVIDKIISSVAPSIFGHRDVKTALACSLFGGVAKDVNGKHQIRGDINVLLLGDPGTAKSQFLKYVEKTAKRAVFATGQGASAVGLTASVRKDPITREWTLEGGALVLADKGVCLIDEFDKMNDADRTSIHEAMEQQSISISKAGIVTSLQARCAIIAAANPNGGRYNAALPLAQNVDLTEPILSRFDVLCVVRDLVSRDEDVDLARFIVDSHTRSHPESGVESGTENSTEGSSDAPQSSHLGPVDQDFLAKYIRYTRAKVFPKLHQMDVDKISRVYVDLRRESIATGGFPITVRHLESILRIAESFARMRMSEFVSASDIDRAIKVSVESFVGAQKMSVKRSLQRSFQKYMLPRRVGGRQTVEVR